MSEVFVLQARVRFSESYHNTFFTFPRTMATVEKLVELSDFVTRLRDQRALHDDFSGIDFILDSATLYIDDAFPADSIDRAMDFFDKLEQDCSRCEVTIRNQKEIDELGEPSKAAPVIKVYIDGRFQISAVSPGNQSIATGLLSRKDFSHALEQHREALEMVTEHPFE